MKTKHQLLDIIKKQKEGIKKGIYSACTANDYVIEAVLERALKDNEYALIEATANQVNQFGGYTGMKADDYRDFVYKIAKKVNFPVDKLILGGDHLGPLTWKDDKLETALNNSIELIKQYVLAGFSKIHIDTSMHVGDDDRNKPLDTTIIAARGAILCKASEDAFRELNKTNPGALHPVYVIGSEVPIPGGSQQEEEGIQITKAEDFKNTVSAFKKAFMEYHLEEAWENVIAVVVQPGVEFGDESIHEYDRNAAKELTNALREYPNLVFEGHSTDYQTAQALKEMVEDGIAILKVGPALTFALREGLFALNYIENEIFKYNPDIELSKLIDTLESSMVRNPNNWKQHYHGSGQKIKYARKFSYSDRCRYYLPVDEVKEALDRLIGNLKTVDIPLTLISQFMPVQYRKIMANHLKNDPEALLKDSVVNCIDDYMYAVTP